MCNPRRIMIHATEQMGRAWQAELERTVRLNGTATGTAHLVQSMSSLLAPAALHAFERAVGSQPDWVLSQGAYHLKIPGGTAVYHPDNGELELTVELSEELVGIGTGTATVTGTVTARSSATGIGTFQARGEWGRTRQQAAAEARRIAREEAQRKADAEAGHLAEQARLAALADPAALRTEAEEKALRDARHDLERQRAERGAVLAAAAESRLDDLRQHTMEGVFRTAANGIRDVLLEYADRHGAVNLQTEESDQVIEIEFEMEA